MTKEFADLFAADPAQRDSDVRREWSNLDLVVRVSGRKPLVVENKTFSLLDEDQLHRYSNLPWVQVHEPTLVLLSLGDPGWEGAERHVDTPAGRRTWKWLPYREVAQRLRAVGRAVDDAFERGLLQRYCDVIDDLVELSAAVASRESDDSPVRLPDNILNPLRKIRLGDGLLKLRTATIARRIHPTRVGADVHARCPAHASLRAWTDEVGRLATPG